MSRPRRGPAVRVLCLLLLALAVSAAMAPARLPAATSAGPERAGSSPPITIVLQPDGANGTDTFLWDSDPIRNFGDNLSLVVGRDASDASVSRSLLRFDLSGIPSSATVTDAALDLFETSGTPGAVEVRRGSAPWAEGIGERAWTSVPVVLQETAGVARTREPVAMTVAFAPGSIVDPAGDLRVDLGGVEVPSQVSAYTYTGGQVTGATLVFGATVPAWGTRTYTISYAANGTAAPAYRMRTFSPAPLWTSPAVGAGASGISVVDLFGDGQLEVLYGTQTGFVFVLNGTGGVVWSTQVSTTDSVPYAPQVTDLDGDGVLDIVVLANDPTLIRLNRSGGIVWTNPLKVPELPLTTPTLLDVNGDGVLDVLLGQKTKAVDAYDGVTGALILAYPVGDWAYTPSVFDVDGDGRGEIFFASDDHLVHAFDASGTELWSGPPGLSFIETSLAIADLDGDGFQEVVVGDDGLNGPQVALSAANGTLVWSTSLPAYREGGQTLADLDGDGRPEVIVGVTTGPLYAVWGTNGTVRWTYSGGTSQAVSPAVVDVTNDGRLELLYIDRDTSLRVLDRDGQALYAWTIPPNDPGLRTLAQKRMATPAVVDLDGDGTLEVIVPTGGGVQAFSTGGLARDWRTYGYNWNHTHWAGDGASPTGASFLVVSVGSDTVHPGGGASWSFRDAPTPWASPGGDFGAPEASAVTSAGWASWNVTLPVQDWIAGAFPNVGLALTEVDEGTGGLHRFASSDAANATSRPRLTVTYTLPLFDPVPQITGTLPDFSRPEDSAPWSLDLSGFAADDDTPLSELRWNLSGYDPAVVQIVGLNVPGGTSLTFSPQRDAWRDMRVTYWLTDPDGRASSRPAWLNLTPVNDAPSFVPPTAFVVRYNATYTFDFGPYLADVDDLPSRLVLLTNDPVHTTISGFNVSFRFPISFLDQWAFVGLTASDGRAATAKVVAVKVTADDPPVLTRSLPDLTFLEGESRIGVFDLDDYFTDPNNDALYFSFGYTHLAITIASNHSVDIRAESNWNGVEQVTFRSKDSSEAIAEDTILVTVVPVNDPPTLAPLPDLVVHYDANYTFNLEPYVDDPDTPLNAINASTSSPYVVVSGHLLTLRYPVALNGTSQPLTVWIGDGLNVASRTIQVRVSDDWPPVLTAKLGDRSFLEDTALVGAYDLGAFFDDPDASPLFYSSGNLNVQVAIRANGSVDLSSTQDWFGTERITFRASDPEGALAEDTVWATVVPVDDAPSFSAIPTVYLAGFSGLLDLTPYLSDVDTNITSLVVVAASANVTVVGQALLFRYGAPARERVELVVSDGLLTDRTTVLVVAAAPQRPEVIPGFLYWLSAAIVGATCGAFALYRRRKIEWAFLVTNGGLLVASVSNEDPTVLDTDLMMGMLTAIMDFTKNSFSDETSRDLEELDLGDRRVEIERGTNGYLAIVYKGRVPGSLPRHMRGFLAFIEGRFPQAFGDVVDTSTVEDIPGHMKRFIDKSWWPFLTFPAGDAPEARE